MCGVIGVIQINRKPRQRSIAADYARAGAGRLQHRGKESAGMASSNGKRIKQYKDIGLVGGVLTENRVHSLKGDLVIAHCRYGTTGKKIKRNGQPYYKEGNYCVSVAHNGNIPDCSAIREWLIARGYQMESTSDTEVFAQLVAISEKPTLEEAVAEACLQLDGAYAMLVLGLDRIVAARDPHGIRPLSLGRIVNEEGELYMLASETCAFDLFEGADHLRDLAPGEILSISTEGIESSRLMTKTTTSNLCIFEYVYFARPDSCMYDLTIGVVRHKMGSNLAQEILAGEALLDPATRIDYQNMDLVMAVPNSGIYSAEGVSVVLGVPNSRALVKDDHSERLFMNPDNLKRGQVRTKLNPLKEAIRGKRVILVDDSVVRGNTSKALIKFLRDCGVQEIHLLVVSPPVIAPCFYGIDTASSSELLAAGAFDSVIKDARVRSESLTDEEIRVRVLEKIRAYLKVDSIRYLSLEGMVSATGLLPEKFCLACFNKNYPIVVDEAVSNKDRFESKVA